MPSVYIPVEPEGNGLGVPMVLSILIHAAIIGFVFFTHRVPKMDIPESIETSIVTPEELAAMQAGIKANREAGQTGTQGDVSSQTYDANLNTNNSAVDNNSAVTDPTTAQKPQVTRQSVPIFIPTDDTSIDETQATQADSRLDSSDIKDMDYERRRQIFSEQMQREAEKNLQEFANEIAEKNEEQKQLVNELKSKKPIIEKPKRVEKSFDPNNNDTDPSSRSTPAWSLSEDGDSLIAGSTAGTRGSQGSQGSTGSRGGGGSIDGALISHIEPYWYPPKNRIGERVVADVTVDANGNVLSIKINSADNELKSSLDSAIRNASPLTPIQGTAKRKLRLHFVVK